MLSLLVVKYIYTPKNVLETRWFTAEFTDVKRNYIDALKHIEQEEIKT